jgi:hypothetical protein
MREPLRQAKDDEALIADLVTVETGTYMQVASRPHYRWNTDVTS